MAKKKAKTTNSALSTMQSMAGAGMENVQMDELAIPFLCIVQSNSPQLSKADGKYIKGAEQGDLFNNVTNEVLYKQGEDPLPFVPCSRQKLYVEWRPRSTGGGLAGMHSDPAIMQQCTRVETPEGKAVDQLPNGNQILPTLYFQGYVTDPVSKSREIMVIAMAMTQMKKGRQWMTQLNNTTLEDGKGGRFPAPMFAYEWEIGTEPETRNNNNFWGWSVSRGALNNDEAVIQDCFTLSKSGTSKLLQSGNSPDQLAEENDSAIS